MKKKVARKKTNPVKRNTPERKNPKLALNESGQYHLKYDSSSGRFGTCDEDLILTIVNQLGSIFGRGRNLGDSEKALLALNSAIASVVELKPRDSIELMLATQMAAIHNTAMELLHRAMLSEQTYDGVEGNINRANKLMRTFTAQVEALNKYRTKGQQKITVQHVNISDGGQAIVGNLKGRG